ncbi:MAG: hypothetical protein JHD15_07200 [Phenylobacterium sp.]|uniref:hypothetical protein n=1 Tax=Phenylobacterium sp. TaxID=1871053 RepID=UPI001A28567C|nr:hypothetical protein [Phenylobacterium sp.]MBJ7410140.1 hypothetical protein [Phenylobacterium sp.]
MPNFLVRLRENHEAVGFFAVEDLEELAFWVDEVCDPSVCEFAEIGSGSIIWEGKARRVPDPDHDWDRETRPMLDIVGEHDLGGTWANALFDDDLEFTPLDGMMLFMPKPANEA